MKLMIEISAGDFIDRLSILEIKKSYGLEVDVELLQYHKYILEFEPIGFKFYKDILMEVNHRLWQLEDSKREFTDRNQMNYTNVAELITQLNDIRYTIKKKIDAYFKSNISEKKNHS